jgi:hypothetical protein
MNTWPEAFATTLVVETVLLLVLFRRRAAWWRAAVAGLVGSGATHPVVWFVLPPLFDAYEPYLVVAESFAVLAEAAVILAILRPRPWYLALAASAATNAASFAIGMFVRHVL